MHLEAAIGAAAGESTLCPQSSGTAAFSLDLACGRSGDRFEAYCVENRALIEGRRS